MRAVARQARAVIPGQPALHHDAQRREAGHVTISRLGLPGSTPSDEIALYGVVSGSGGAPWAGWRGGGAAVRRPWA